MPEGSSSAAPVITPGPRTFRKRLIGDPCFASGLVGFVMVRNVLGNPSALLNDGDANNTAAATRTTLIRFYFCCCR